MGIHVDIAVIGGGASGLAAAALAAREGAKVALFEKSGRLGGRACSTKQHGTVLNLGAHALYREGASSQVLRELGIPITGGSPGPDINWYLNSGTFVSTAGLLLGRTLNWLEKRQVLSAMLGLRRMEADAFAGRSWEEQMSGMGLTGKAAQVMAAMGRLGTYAGKAGEVDASVVIRQLRQSVQYPDGGWQTIIDSLIMKCKDEGVSMYTNEGIVSVDRDDEHGFWLLRLKDGTEAAAKQVIAAADPGLLERFFRPWLSEAWLTAALELEPLKAACLDIVLSRLPEPKRTFALGLDAPLYLSVHSRWAELSPNKAYAVLHAMRYDGAAEDPAAIESELELMLDRLQPGWRAYVLFKRYMPGLLVTHAKPVWKSQGTLGRPAVETGAPGLYAAGDWAGTEGILLDAALASARRAAELALSRR